MMYSCYTALLLSLVVTPLLSISPTSHLTTQDKARIGSVFTSSLSGDTASLHYSLLGLQLLGEKVEDASSICSSVSELANDGNVETLYHASGIGAALGCPLTLGTEAAQAVESSLGDGATTASLFFAAKTQASVGARLDSAAVKKGLTAALKKDDTLLSLGLAFHTASMLDGDLAKFFDRIEDAVVQADEVDGKMLQFEGGLSVTSVVLTGAARLAVKAKKMLPVTGEQAVKFGNYLMSRKSVQQPKGAFHLLEAVMTMANNPQHIPLVIALASSVSVSAENPHVVVSVTDLAGGSPGDFSVVLDTATRQEDGAVVAAKQSLTHMVTTTKHTVDLMAANPPAGFYELSLTATPVKADARYVGNTGVTLTVKVLTTITVDNAELKVVDAEQSTTGKTVKLTYPNTEKEKISIDYKERILINFNVLDSVSEKAMLIHQAFIKLTHLETSAEIIYVAEAANTKLYMFDLDLGQASQDFNSKSGAYSVSIILGDAVITNPTSWHVADVNINFPDDSSAKEPGLYSAKPEIRHLFREPEPRPSTIVSNAFTLLCLSPVLIMLAFWLKLGVNCSNFPFSLTAVGFHVGLACIFLLYTYFWLELNMFQTMKYLTVLGVITFLCGNSLLASIAKRTKTA
jgi:oligosaccharyltransferase complex subunit delta (ribophorin II)